MDQFNMDENNTEAQQPEESVPAEEADAPVTDENVSSGENASSAEEAAPKKRDIIDVIDNISISQNTPQQPPQNQPKEENNCFTENISDMYHEMPGNQSRPYTPYGMPPNPYANTGYNGGGYSNGYNNGNGGQYGYPPPPQQNFSGYRPMQQPGPAYGGAVPVQKKKTISNGGIAAVILTISALFIIVIIILAVSTVSDNGSSDSSSNNDRSSSPVISGSKNDGVTIELPVSSKPSVEPQYYEDEETGLLTVQGVAKQVSPSVVDVMVYRDTSLYPYSTGSGIIISSDGYIVTNAHVVADVNAGLKVILDSEKEYKAEIIGQDKKTDIAVLKIEADEELISAELGDSDELELGEMVVAIGNAGGYSGTLTVGYVSGLNREVKTNSGSDTMTCIQTDAAMSPGVSGGALINMYGQVVGITSSKYKNTELDEGIGFAISTKFAKPIIEDIISLGYIEGRVRVGITYTTIDDLTADTYKARRGLLIQTIDESCDIYNTEAAPGDIITSINGHEVYSAQTVQEALDGCKPGDVIKAEIFRKGITDDEAEEFEIEFELMQDTSLS